MRLDYRSLPQILAMTELIINNNKNDPFANSQLLTRIIFYQKNEGHIMKKIFKRLLPSASQMKSHPRLQFLGKFLHEPNLWHLNRRTLAGGAAVGLFIAFMPVPIQMLLAALLAIWFRVNLPLSISLVWITNPITIPPLFYFAYQCGSILLGVSTLQTEFQLDFSPECIVYLLGHFFQPLLLGCLILGALCAAMGYWLVNLLWRLQITYLWRERREKRLKKWLATKQKLSQLAKVSA